MTGTRLVQSCSIKHGVVTASNELGRQVSAVVNGEQIPSVDGADDFARRGHQWQGGSVKAVIMASGAIDDVPRSSGVVKLLGHTIGDSCVALVEMLMAMQDKVDTVLKEEGFER